MYMVELPFTFQGFLHFPGIPPNVGKIYNGKRHPCSLPPFPAHAVSDLIHNTERRVEWDSFFSIIEILEEHKNFRVVYWYIAVYINMLVHNRW